MKPILFFITVLIFTNIAAFSETEPNNTLLQANNLPYNGNESGSLTGTDTEDWFLINIPQGGIFTLNVKKTGAGNGTLYLYDGEKTGNPEIANLNLSYGDSPGNGWTLTAAVSKGKYYARFLKSSNPVNYQVAAALAAPSFAEDTEPNDTVTKALTMPVPGPITGNIHYYTDGKGIDKQDWYKIQLTKGGILNLMIQKKGTGHTWIHFRDGIKNGFPEISYYYTGFAESPAEGWKWSYPVLAGTYYFQIEGGEGVVDYKLDVSLTAPAFSEDQEPNDTIASALTMPFDGSVSGNVHYYTDGKGLDQRDWYKIQLSRGGILSLKINKKGAGDTWIHFRDGIKSGFPEISYYYTGLAESPADGWKWSYPVLAGTYYFQVEGGNGVVDYKLDISLIAPAFTEDTEPNDTITKALAMSVPGPITGNIHYYTDGKGTDKQDWYKIQLSQGGILNLMIHKKGPGHTWVHFRDGIKSGSPEISYYYTGFSESPAEGWKWSCPVLAGTYYFQIEGGEGIVDYKLDVSLVAPVFPEDTEPDDSVANALIMPVPGSVTGNVHYYVDGKVPDPKDWYKMEINKGGILSLKIHKKGNGHTWIHFRDGIKQGFPELSNYYTGFSESPAEGWNWSYPVLAGIYYFQVEGGEGVVDYKLDISLIAPAFNEDSEPNDTITKALTMPVPGSITGNVHYYADGKGVDSRDWYKIQLTQGGILNIKIQKKGPGDAWIHLRDGLKSGNPDISYYYTGFLESPAEGWTLSYPVLAGAYYIHVDGGINVFDYKLDISLIPPIWGEDKESNDSLKYAGIFTVNDSVTGLIGYYKPGYGSDTWDWYVIKTSEFGYLSFQIQKKGNYGGNVTLRDTIREISSQNLGYGDFKAVFGKVVPKGKYYLVFQKYDGDLQYKARMIFKSKPKADYSWTQTDNSLTFENTTFQGETYQWDFKDGTKSTAVNPSHDYIKPGDYDVCLIAKNVAGNDTICKKVVLPGIDRIFPAEGGNTGDVTFQIFGGGLDTFFVARIMQGPTVIATSNLTILGGKSSIQVRFDLRAKPVGTYDLKIEKSGGPFYLLPGGFKITLGKSADPWVNISGRNRILFNTWTTYTVKYGNYGNVDAVMVPFWLTFSKNQGLDIDFTDVFIQESDSASGLSMYENIYTDTDSLFGKPAPTRVYPLMIPLIPAGSVNSFKIRIKTGGNLNMNAWTEKPWYQSPVNETKAGCTAAIANAAPVKPSPQVTCFKIAFIAKLGFALAFNEINKKNPLKQNIVSVIKIIHSAGRTCNVKSKADRDSIASFMIDYIINSLITPKPQKKSAVILSDIPGCNDDFVPQNSQKFPLAAVTSLDPNEKSGPSGYGTENYVAVSRNFPYVIYFENKSSATAPAHTVVISDQLDKSKLDLSSFSFGNISIGDSVLQIKSGLKSFSLDKKLDKLKLVARISGILDTLTGRLEWKLRSLDPVTLADIDDPDVGLLPANITPPQGQGSVSFFVRLKNDPIHKFSVTNQASIEFDANPPIVTNKHLTTFDLVPPQSVVQSLSATTTARQFPVKWAGTDDGSGIDSYNIFVKKNNGTYDLWLAGTAETSAVYKSSADGFYQFISVAIDKTGNIETPSDNPDATTNVVTAAEDERMPDTEIMIYPTPSTRELIANIGIAGRFTIRVYGADGRLRMEKMMNGNSITGIKTGALPRGLYLWQMVNDDFSVKKSGKFVINK